MAETTLIVIPAALFDGDDVPVVADDVPAAFEYLASSGRECYAFDDTDEWAIISPLLQMPAQYAGGTLKCTLLGIFASETTATDEAVFNVSVEAVTPGDEVDLDAGVSFDAVNAGEIDPAATAGHLCGIDITLTNKDSVAAGDDIRLGIRRDCDHANDTANGDFRLLSVRVWEDV